MKKKIIFLKLEAKLITSSVNPDRGGSKRICEKLKSDILFEFIRLKIFPLNNSDTSSDERRAL